MRRPTGYRMVEAVRARGGSGTRGGRTFGCPEVSGPGTLRVGGQMIRHTERIEAAG
jgi:hypothetical protein